jgi:hypothetical protein
MTRKVFRSLAWGYHEPGGCVLWWIVEPTRHLHILSELDYEQLDEQELATQICTRDRALRLGPPFVARCAYTVGTPAIVSTKAKKPGFRGETIGDRLAHYGVIVIPADDDLLNGWKRCQSLLRTDAHGDPWLTIDPSCEPLIRAIPSGLRDDKEPDDLLAPSPALTALRYGAMSRPAPDTITDIPTYPFGSAGYYIQRGIREGQARHG